MDGAASCDGEGSMSPDVTLTQSRRVESIRMTRAHYRGKLNEEFTEERGRAFPSVDSFQRIYIEEHGRTRDAFRKERRTARKMLPSYGVNRLQCRAFEERHQYRQAVYVNPTAQGQIPVVTVKTSIVHLKIQPRQLDLFNIVSHSA